MLAQHQTLNGSTSYHQNPANTRYWPNVVVMLDQRSRRWPNITPTLGQYIVLGEREQTKPFPLLLRGFFHLSETNLTDGRTNLLAGKQFFFLLSYLPVFFFYPRQPTLNQRWYNSWPDSEKQGQHRTNNWIISQPTGIMPAPISRKRLDVVFWRRDRRASPLTPRAMRYSI